MPAIASALLRTMLLAVVVFGPLLVGIPENFESRYTALALGAVLGYLTCLVTVLSTSRSEGLQKIVWAVLTIFVSVTVLDVGLRPLVGPLVIQQDRTYVWPQMPLVKRFAPNVRYHGTVYGNLAQDPGMRVHAQRKDFVFITDQFGFRNERNPGTPLDVVVVGDSFATGYQTTQDRAWPAVLSRRYGLKVYNLGVYGASPWEDYANLLIEIDRLAVRRGGVIIWNLYTGNNLFEPCYETFDKRELPWRTGVWALKGSFLNFRERSPLGRSLPRLWELATQGPEGPNVDTLVRRFPNGSETLFSRWDAVEAHRSLDSVRNAPTYDCIRHTIAAMKRFARSRKLTVGIQVAPTKDEVYPWLYEEGRPLWSPPPSPSGFALAIAEICQQEQIPFLDLMPPLVAASKRVYEESGGQLYWPDDSHWSAAGNDEVAKIAHEFYVSVRSSETGN